MDSFDNMDIEDMLNNPLKNVDMTGNKPRRAEKPGGTGGAPPPIRSSIAPAARLTESDFTRMDKNHPMDDRVLSLEKNLIIADEKNDTLRRIIEEQNNRIAKIEEELAILREHLIDDDTGSRETDDDE